MGNVQHTHIINVAIAPGKESKDLNDVLGLWLLRSLSSEELQHKRYPGLLKMGSVGYRLVR